MRILITGATGNVGSALLRRLAGSGHDLVGLVRRIPSRTGAYANVEWVSADLSRPADEPLLRSAAAGADAVVHLAWAFQPSHDLAYLAELGVGGTQRVIDAVRESGVPHLVHMSSVGAYSPKVDDAPVDEDWPTEGVPSSPYSRNKVAAERLLDAHERSGDGTVVTRMRPGIVGQRSAGSALLRYGVPAVIPARAIGFVPVLPVDRRLAVPMVHADDVADAITRALDQRSPGAFNLAADPPITTQDIASVLHAHVLDVPAPVVRAAVSTAWHARLQPVDPGWVDLGFAVPTLDTTRAERELSWQPSHDGRSVLEETLAGMREARAGQTPVLRNRTVLGQLGRLVRRGPVSHRKFP